MCNALFAAEDKLIPALEIREEFNDNLFLTAKKRQSDFITTLMPSMTYSHSSERRNINLLTGVNGYVYSRSNAADSTDYQLRGQFNQRLSERNDMEMSSDYVRTTRPDGIDTVTGLPTNSGRDQFHYGVSVKRAVSEDAAASLGYSYANDRYDNRVFLGNRSHLATVQLSKDLEGLMPRLKGFVTGQFNTVDYRNSNTDNYTLRLGANRAVSEKLTMNLSIGGRFSRSRFTTQDPVTLTQTTAIGNDWGVVGSASVNYVGERNFGSVAFNRDFSAASGQVGAIDRTSLDLTVGRAITDRIKAQCAVSYSRNQSSNGQFSSLNSDFRPLNIKTDLFYRISNYFDLGVQYVYFAYGNTDARIFQNSVMLRLVAKYPFTL